MKKRSLSERKGGRALGPTLRGLLPWILSFSLLGYVLISHDLKKVAEAFVAAKLAPFIFLVAGFVGLWLFLYSLSMYFGLVWFMEAPSPEPGYKPPPRPRFLEIVKATAASYLLRTVNFLLGYGGLVVYFKKRFQVSYQRASAVMLMDMLTGLTSISLLALLFIRLVPEELIPSHAELQIELAETVGVSGIFFFLACLLSSRLWRYFPPRFQDRETVFTPFSTTPFFVYPALVGFQLLSMLSFGLFVILAMPLFGLEPPPLVSAAFTQLVLLARGLPVSAQGIGLDQLTFPFLFQGFGEPESLVAFSIAFTFSIIAVRFIIGIPFFTRAAREMFEPDAS